MSMYIICRNCLLFCYLCGKALWTCFSLMHNSQISNFLLDSFGFYMPRTPSLHVFFKLVSFKWPNVSFHFVNFNVKVFFLDACVLLLNFFDVMKISLPVSYGQNYFEIISHIDRLFFKVTWRPALGIFFLKALILCAIMERTGSSTKLAACSRIR